jgi:hypothetical protein
MFEKAKTFVKEHKKEIMCAGCVVGAIIGGVVIGKHINKTFVEYGKEVAGKKVIMWNPSKDHGFMSLERVKNFMEANAGNAAPYAVFREGPDPDAFVCILLDDKAIIPELQNIVESI